MSVWGEYLWRRDAEKTHGAVDHGVVLSVGVALVLQAVINLAVGEAGTAAAEEACSIGCQISWARLCACACACAYSRRHC